MDLSGSPAYRLISWIILVAMIFGAGGSVVAYSYATFEHKDNAQIRETYINRRIEDLKESMERANEKLDRLIEGQSSSASSAR